MSLVWITGGSSGIGFATAKKFLNNNWKVIISSRNNKKLLRAKNLILKTEDNKELYCYQCDISDRNQVIDVVEKITKNLGAINLAILNADDGVDGVNIASTL